MRLFSKNEILTWLGIGGILLLPTLFSVPFTFPQADDYGYAELALNNNWKTEFIRLYQEWSGRYTSIIMGFLSPLSFHQEALYSSSIFLIILLFIYSNYLFFRAITSKFKSKVFSLICSLIFSAVYFNLIPSPGESLFWYSGIITYIFPTVLFQFACYFISLYYHNKSFSAFVLGAVLLVLSIGGNEVLTVSILLISSLTTWILNRLNNEHYKSFSILLIIILVATGFMLIAPGNRVRSEFFENHLSLSKQFILTDLQIVRFAFEWLGNISAWVLFITSLFVGQFARQKGHTIKILQAIPGVVYIALPIVFLYLSIFPAYFTMGMLGQHRTLAPGLFFFLLWIIIFGVRLGYASQLIAILMGLFDRYLKVISVLFVGAMLFTGNNKAILDDLFSGRFESYFISNIERNKTIKEALKEDKKNVHLPGIKEVPSSFTIMDIKSDSSHWINQNWARYYGLNQVKLSDEK